MIYHDDVIKWKHFPHYWPFVRGIHRLPHKSQWRGALMFSLICVWINDWVNNREAGDLRRYRAHYVVTVMLYPLKFLPVSKASLHKCNMNEQTQINWAAAGIWLVWTHIYILYIYAYIHLFLFMMNIHMLYLLGIVRKRFFFYLSNSTFPVAQKIIYAQIC